MIFIVDTNILFSACITPAGRIFEILFNAPPYAQLTSSHFAIEELALHKSKLIKLSGYMEEDVDILLSTILKQIDFINEEIINTEYWQEAVRLTSGVDSKDVSFVALALQTGGWLWTGDKKLSAHLKTMGFDRVINTAELYNRLEIR
ncbi:MAG TPA: PIN domain-containing protein [Mucilaginibacter sp.]|jgi:predicted nucleic acid-binding protein|nr:PIN domain-containing protein [Mucilaginibacter sp.]